MIPKNIKRKHILKAIEEIEKVGIPKGRISREFLLEYNGKHYPPKYAISLANKYANGEELAPSKFSGGGESNDRLKHLGFNIVRTQFSEKPTPKPSIKAHKIAHDERCPRCKETIKIMLEKIYGKVETNYKFDVGVYPKDYKNTAYYKALKAIYEVLQSYRGHKEFLRAKTLPNCDFFIPDPGFILEFDESQHFTIPRKKALEQYPENLELGFDRQRWMNLCEKIKAKDNDPPYRDEQRAWYDTLRDFLPTIKGLKPTIRIFAKDFKWCSLKPDNPSDVQRFKSLLKGEFEKWKIEVREESNPFLARIIIASDWNGNPEEAKKLLEDVCKKWSKGKRVKFLMTCGAFIQFDWPKAITRREIGDNKNPETEYVNSLIKEAERCVKDFLSGSLGDKLKRVTDYITLGIDSYKEKISTTKNYIGELHIELVCLVDLRNNRFYWTGKTYPTNSQENGLVRITDMKTHFFELKDVGRIMVFGCHDLSIFNNRNMKKTGEWRKNMKLKFRALAQKEKPVLVLHHPHTTVKVTTWRNAWSNLQNTLPSVKQYAGTGRYFESDRERSKWDALDEVLQSTKRSNTIDFIVWKNKCSDNDGG